MSIPDFQSLMLPLMKFAADQREHASRETADYLAQAFQLSDAEREEMLSSGQQTIFDNRVYWGIAHLKRAGLIESTRRGFFRITPRGQQILQQPPTKIDIRFLKQFPEYRQFIAPKRDKTANEEGAETITSHTPMELLEGSYQSIRQELAQELLNQVKKSSPAFFERLVVDLLLRMGYGGSRVDAGEAIGRSGDEGIDGTIKEDRLGLDTIYIQAKRWGERTVGRPDIMQFVGALSGKNAKKGVYITTSTFSDEAREFVNRNIGSTVVLIDGKMLAELMIDFNVGVFRVASYEIKKINNDYFNEV